MRSFRLARTFSGLSFILGLFVSERVAAYPVRGEHRDMAQPDGSQVEVVLWGDEFYMRAETPNGYTLVIDPKTQFITYALATPDGNLVSSGVVYDGIASDVYLATRGIVPGARHSKPVRNRLSADKRARLNPGGGTISLKQNTDGTYQLDVISLAILPATTGTATGLVVLVDFSDRTSTIPISEVENAFNSTGTYGTTWHGSIRNWSEQISGGITSVQHKVVGFYRAKYNVAHYNAPTAEWDYSTADELYKEVYAYIDANVDLTSYAINSVLPSLAVVYAGDIISQGWAMALWPHGGCGGGRYRTSEGVTISQCLMTNLGTRTPLNLETFRHELGHSFFHWPDTYDYDDDSESSGGFATETDLPCAPFRMWAGWITPYDVTSNPGVYSLAANGSSFLRYNNASNAAEYFVAEYAKKAARRNPPDEGLLIWHIDEKGDNSWQDMTATRHYMMSVEQADGKFDLEHNVRAGAGDLFHAGDKDQFDGTTTPNSNWWNGSSSGFKVCNIGDLTTDTMTVNAGCVSTGGTTSTGGASNTGGARTTGGVTSAGGTSSTGGARTTGGVTSAGGTSSTGGAKATGGVTSAGGTSSTGGANASGGVASTGARSSTGGTSSTGGANASGGLASTGGRLSSGGSSSSSSGSGTSAIPGGTSSVPTSTTGTGSSGQEETGSCSCRTAGRSHFGWAGVSILGLLGLGWRRRRNG